MTAIDCAPLTVAPARVLRGDGILVHAGADLARVGRRPLAIGGDRALALVAPTLTEIWQQEGLAGTQISYGPEACEASLARLEATLRDCDADCIVGVGGGKALDTAKLVACRGGGLPVVTIPTSGATCAAWTGLSNVYSETGAFLYDVTLERCPDLLILDYGLVRSAPRRTLVAGIGDAIAKWYEASVSSGRSEASTTIAAVQGARVLRDILLQKAAAALAAPESQIWREVVDATVLLAGVSGGMGGAKCRTVAAHALHNGLTHLPAARGSLHGEKVAYGILVQLRLEEIVRASQLAAAARQQLLQFYGEIGLPKSLDDLGLGDITLSQLRRVAEVACAPNSDIHGLPFPVRAEQVLAAMVSTTLPTALGRSSSAATSESGESSTSRPI